MTTDTTQPFNQKNESNTALCQVELGKYIPEKLEPRDKIMWQGNEDIEPWVNLTPILKQVEYREHEGSNSVSAKYSGVCPDGCFTGGGNQKNNRTLRFEVYGGPRASVRGWCTECSLAGSELADRVMRDVKPVPVKTNAGIDLNTVEPKSIEWLWERRIALGKVTLLDGDPGLGKSILTIDIAARLSTGRGLTDSEQFVSGGVILVGTEDGIPDTIVPRLREAKADLTRISVLNTVIETDKDGNEYERPFTLQTDLNKLRGEIERKGAKLVIIDSLMGVLGVQTDSYKDQSVRRALMPLVRLAEELNIAVLAIRHVTKNSADNVLYRGGGSIAMIGIARTSLMVLQHPNDENIRVLINPKNNLSKMAVPLEYEIVGKLLDDIPRVEWRGASELTMTELTSNNKPSEGRQLILEVLQATTKRLSPEEVQSATGIEKIGTVKQLLRRMLADNQIAQPSRGFYTSLSTSRNVNTE